VIVALHREGRNGRDEGSALPESVSVPEQLGQGRSCAADGNLKGGVTTQFEPSVPLSVCLFRHRVDAPSESLAASIAFDNVHSPFATMLASKQEFHHD
jgi:hypothetical protein